MLPIQLTGHATDPEPRRLTVAARISVGRAPGSVALADLNNDDRLDIIVASEQDNSLTVLLADDSGRFTEAPGSPVAAGSMPNDIAVADFNGDDRLDIAVANHEVCPCHGCRSRDCLLSRYSWNAVSLSGAAGPGFF
jgi:hypothetical protein